MKKLKILLVLLCICLMISTFSACGSSPKKDIVGQWVGQGTDVVYFDFKKNGSFWCDEGSGTYVVGSKTLKISAESEQEIYTWTNDYLSENQTGNTWYVDGDFLFMWGSYFTRAGKNQEKILKKYLKNKNNKSQKEDEQNNQSSYSNSSYSSANGAVMLDAFNGLEPKLEGISPFCTVQIDASLCSTDVKNHVEFSADKECYANGEKIIVSADIDLDIGKYSLLSRSKEFEVSNMPEYAVSLADSELSVIKAEVADFITSKKAEAVNGESLFGISSYDAGCDRFLSVSDVEESDVYFITIKENRRDSINNYGQLKDKFNSLHFLYTVKYQTEKSDDNPTGQGVAYIDIMANNIAKYPDGSVKWGSEKVGDFDFAIASSLNSLDELKASSITINSANYNIQKIEF